MYGKYKDTKNMPNASIIIIPYKLCRQNRTQQKISWVSVSIASLVCKENCHQKDLFLSLQLGQKGLLLSNFFYF